MLMGIAPLLDVVTATIAAWFVDRLRRVEVTEARTEATLSDVLIELRPVRVRFEELEGLGPTAPTAGVGRQPQQIMRK